MFSSIGSYYHLKDREKGSDISSRLELSMYQYWVSTVKTDIRNEQNDRLNSWKCGIFKTTHYEVTYDLGTQGPSRHITCNNTGILELDKVPHFIGFSLVNCIHLKTLFLT